MEKIPKERENSVPWEVADGRRQQLVGTREPVFEY
jgi:hypothetical protein